MKKIISLVLAFALVLTLMPAVTLAATTDVTSYGLYICGTQVTSINAEDLSVIEGVDGTVSFDPESNTLYLENASIDGPASYNYNNYATISVKNSISALNIKFKGTNTIGCEQNNNINTNALAGLHTDFIFTGTDDSAMLTVKAKNERNNAENGAGRVNTVTVNKGTVSFEAPKEQYTDNGYKNNPYGVSLNAANGNLITINGGKLICKGWAPIVAGMDAPNKLQSHIADGTVLKGSANYDGTGLEDYNYSTNGFYDSGYQTTYRYVEATGSSATTLSSYTVTVTLGENMENFDGSGELSQTINAGTAITEIRIGTSGPAFFPDDYASLGTYNGVTVALDEGKLVISGTPTQDTQIELADAESYVFLQYEIGWAPYATGTVSYSYMYGEYEDADVVEHLESEELYYFNNGSLYVRQQSITLHLFAVPGEDSYLDEENTSDGTGTYADNVAFVEALLSEDGAVLNVTNEEEYTISISFASDYEPEPETSGPQPYIPWITPQPSKPSEPNVPVTPETESDLPFNDVDPADDFYDYIKFVYEKGLMDGMSDTNFDLYGNLTRGMLMTVLYRMEGKPGVAYTGRFSDVAEDAWYADAIEWAASVGIANGYSDGRFGPNDPVTREQLAAFLYRYAGFKGYPIMSGTLAVDDFGKISEYALDALMWAVENDVLRVSNGTVRPTEYAKRWEIAAALFFLVQNIVK